MSEAKGSTLLYRDVHQFLRFCEVTVKDFRKETKIVIGNEFEIEFEYFKTIDQTVEDDTGRVTIYGLKPETISLLEEEGGELWFRCGYEQSSIHTLFISYISRVYTEVVGNTTATTFECSANLLSHFYSGYANASEEVVIPLSQLLQNLGTSLGFGYTRFNVDNVPDEHKEKLVKFLATYKTTYFNIGDLRTIVEQVCEQFGFTFQRVLFDDEDTGVFAFTDTGMKNALKIIERGYVSINLDGAEVDGRRGFFVSMLNAPESLRAGFFLTKETGLIDSQAEYQLVSSHADQKLTANEFETAESQFRRNNPEQRKVKKSKGGSEITASLASRPQNGTPSGGDSDNPLVPISYLSHLTIKPNLIKGTKIVEATGGGMVRGDTVVFATSVQKMIGSAFVRFTAFNDHYHKVNSPNSLHTQGKAFDFTINTGKSGAPNAARAVRKLAETLGYRVKVDDEYNRPSKKATGGHIHVEVFGKGAAKDSEKPDSQPAKLDFDSVDVEDDGFGRVPTEIFRRYNRITALLNPQVIPQSLIFTEAKSSSGTREEGEAAELLAHRVRHATYNGNNKRGDWVMELYCEDTSSSEVSGFKVPTTPSTRDLASPELG